MDSKAKARQIIDQFLRIEDDTQFYWNAYDDIPYTDNEVIPHAKKCALIVVDEILNGSKVIGTKAISRRKYWYNVREDIIAL